MTKYDVIISPEAERLMANCVLFLAEQDLNAGLSLKVRLIESIGNLDHLPARYPFFNESYIPANKYHKMFVENWYLILYQIKDNVVYIDYVLDCRQDYQWLIH
ncbi:MAG: type II toxin-antitoxin system RelE/ParE family toxin [Clostridia bacterium]